ncbi:MAG TPA: RHS repeat-associated core domain-containing protein, partial [Longimicrobium sp.]|nr:RHS repeat-associated core domain-containing protein [Longimicrobium sp.]
FAVVDGVVFFFAGGVQLFAWSYANPNTQLPDVGKVALVAGATAQFDDLVVLNDPQLSMTFRDGFGTAMQSVSLLGLSSTGTGYPTVAQGALFDALGRPYVSRNPAQPLLAIDQGTGSTARYLVEGDQATYLVSASGQQLTVSQYLSGTSGYDYTQQVYENSPLSRVLQVILPREAGQSAANFTVAYAYGAATAALVQGVLPTGTTAGNYAMASETDQDGTTTSNLFTALGQLVASRTALGGGAYHTVAYGYDAAGNLTTVYQPNYFQPPTGSVAAAWVETRTYTFNGLLSGRTTPDGGATTFLYDNLDRLRFAQDADGAAASPPRFVYNRYDALNRLVETGYVQDAAVTLAVLQGKVNDPAYPNLANVGGKWRKRVHYDATDTGAAANLVGRVWKVEINNNTDASQPDTQLFAYDADGYTLQETSVVRGYGTDAYVTAYTYDNLKNVSTLQYPSKTGETPLQVGYTYDRLGRLAAVGKPVAPGTVVDPAHPATADEALYAAYAYAPWGGLVQESLNNRRDGTQSYTFTRGYTYNQPGWLRTASDPFFSESLDYYEQPGYGGARYYNGQISRASYGFPMNGEPCPPPEYTYLYGYDALRRLQASQCSAGDAFSLYAGAQGYDANGNRATLRRGATTSGYGYQQSSSSQQVVSNRLYQVTDSAASSITFDGSATVWTWGASNAGPSASVVKPKDGGGSYLQLAGGSLGHYEYLELDTYLSPAGTYQLSCSVRTPAGWSADTGAAGWYLAVAAPTGTFAATLLGAVPDTGGQWQSFDLASVNVPALLASLGPGVEVASVSLQLRNYRRKSAGTGAGSSFDVATVSLQTTASVVGQPFTYSAAGNVAAAPARGITSIAYDPVIGLTTGVTAAGATTSFTYDGQGSRSLASSTASTRLYLRGAETSPLRIRTRTGTQEQDLYLIHGARGITAFQRAGGVYFPLTDHLGSTRAVVDSSNQPVAALDYLPFGGTMRASGSPGTDYLYTAQELDPRTGLYNFGARLYDPVLGRFYATDPVTGARSPYAYAANNPAGFLDPGGNEEGWFNAIWTTAGSVGAAAGVVASTYASVKLLPTAFGFANPVTAGTALLGSLMLNHLSSRLFAWFFDRSDFENTWYGSYWNQLTDFEAIGWMEKEGGIWKRVYDVLKNFSRQEAAVLIREYPLALAPVQVPWTLVNVYAWATQDAMNRYWAAAEFKGDPRGANAVRHIVWMCTLRRKWTSSSNFARSYGHAHEIARENPDPTDSLADTLNNELSMYYAATDSRDCVEIAFSLLREGKLAQNAEGSNLESLKWDTHSQQAIAASFRNTVQKLKELGVPLPKLPEGELDKVRKDYPEIGRTLDDLYGVTASGPEGGPASP